MNGWSVDMNKWTTHTAGIVYDEQLKRQATYELLLHGETSSTREISDI